MVKGLRLLIDGKTSVFSNLHNLLSLLGPSRIDESFLAHDFVHSYCILLQPSYSYEEHSLQLTVTMITRPKRKEENNAILFNTLAAAHLMNFADLVIVSNRTYYSSIRIIYFLFLYCFLHSSSLLITLVQLSFTLLGHAMGIISHLLGGSVVFQSSVQPEKTESILMSWPRFAIILRTEEGRSIFTVYASPKNTLDTSTNNVLFFPFPTLKNVLGHWMIVFRASVKFDLSLSSDNFHVECSAVDLSLRSESCLPTRREIIKKMRGIFSNINSKNSKREKNEKNEKKKLAEDKHGMKSAEIFSDNYGESSSVEHSSFKPSYIINIVGNVLNIKLKEDSFDTSMYLKMKAFFEKYRGRKRESSNPINKQNEGIHESINGNMNENKRENEDKKIGKNDNNPIIILNLQMKGISVYNHNENVPTIIAMSTSFIFSHFEPIYSIDTNMKYLDKNEHKNNKNIKNNTNNKNNILSEKDYVDVFSPPIIKIEFKCDEMQLFINWNDNNRITLSDVSLIYSYSNKKRNINQNLNEVSGINSSDNISINNQKGEEEEEEEEGENEFLDMMDFKCKKCDVEILEEILDRSLDATSVRTLKYFCFILQRLLDSVSRFSRISFLIDGLSVQIVHFDNFQLMRLSESDEGSEEGMNDDINGITDIDGSEEDINGIDINSIDSAGKMSNSQNQDEDDNDNKDNINNNNDVNSNIDSINDINEVTDGCRSNDTTEETNIDNDSMTVNNSNDINDINGISDIDNLSSSYNTENHRRKYKIDININDDINAIEDNDEIRNDEIRNHEIRNHEIRNKENKEIITANSYQDNSIKKLYNAINNVNNIDNNSDIIADKTKVIDHKKNHKNYQASEDLVPDSRNLQFASTIFIPNLSGTLKKKFMNIEGQKVNVYFGELLESNVFDMVPLTDSMSAVENEWLWKPE